MSLITKIPSAVVAVKYLDPCEEDLLVQLPVSVLWLKDPDLYLNQIQLAVSLLIWPKQAFCLPVIAFFDVEEGR